MINEIKERRKLLFYGWKEEASTHFGVSSRTIEDWLQHKNTGTKRAIRRSELRTWSIAKMQSSGLTDDQVDEKIKEAFGE